MTSASTKNTKLACVRKAIFCATVSSDGRSYARVGLRPAQASATPPGKTPKRRRAGVEGACGPVDLRQAWLGGKVLLGRFGYAREEETAGCPLHLRKKLTHNGGSEAEAESNRMVDEEKLACLGRIVYALTTSGEHQDFDAIQKTIIDEGFAASFTWLGRPGVIDGVNDVCAINRRVIANARGFGIRRQ